MEKVSIVLPGRAISSLRESDFDTCSAVGEVIDNSIQAEATSIHIQVQEQELPAAGRRRAGTKNITQIAFGDNGYGMNADTLHHCMQLGFSSRYNDRSGIGRFGVGMTLGAINQCKKIEVYSKDRGGSSWLYTCIDLDEIAEEYYIPGPEEKDLPECYKNLIEGSQGTLVIWSKIDRITQGSSAIKHWIARTYRKFIGNHVVLDGQIVEKDNPIKITLNGELIKAFDPLYAIPNEHFPDGQSAQLFGEIKISMPVPEDANISERSSTVIIRMSLTPEEWRKEAWGKSGSSQLARNLFVSDNEGFSILRANREVLYDIMPHFKPSVHADGFDRWWSAEICFDPALDKYFSVRNIKRGARFLRELREVVEDKMGPTIRECRKKVDALFTESRNKVKFGSRDVTTEHTLAENAVKVANPVSGKSGKEKTDEEKNREIEEITKAFAKTQQDLDAWKAKIKAQPCTIVDNEGNTWKGDTFLDIHPQGGHTIIEYNMAHDFFVFVYDAIKQLTNCKQEQHSEIGIKNAKKLKVAIDLLFMAYAQAESLIDLDMEQRAGDTLHFLHTNWGVFLRQFIKSFEKNSES